MLPARACTDECMKAPLVEDGCILFRKMSVLRNNMDKIGEIVYNDLCKAFSYGGYYYGLFS